MYLLFFKIYPFKAANLKDKERILLELSGNKYKSNTSREKLKLNLDIPKAPFNSRMPTKSSWGDKNKPSI